MLLPPRIPDEPTLPGRDTANAEARALTLVLQHDLDLKTAALACVDQLNGLMAWRDKAELDAVLANMTAETKPAGAP